MSIGWPEGILLGLMFLEVCRYASNNGQRRNDHYDLGMNLANHAILLALLWWGGFFA